MCLKNKSTKVISINTSSSTNVPDGNGLNDTVADRSRALMSQIIDQTNGIFCTFDEIMPKLVVWEKKQKRRMAWKCDLEIGSKIRIKIAAYIYVNI